MLHTHTLDEAECFKLLGICQINWYFKNTNFSIIFDVINYYELFCSAITTSLHAFKRMISRDISDSDVQMIIREGEIIKEYPDDIPYPSVLIYKMIGERPIHAVVGKVVETNHCIVITVYIADDAIWELNYKTKK